mgnify:CR=1 FL=1
MLQTVFLTRLYDVNRIKTNFTHTSNDRMVSAIEYLCVGYYNAILKKKVLTLRAGQWPNTRCLRKTLHQRVLRQED